MRFKYRKTKSKQDTLIVARRLSEKFSIAPYEVEQLAGVIRAGARVCEIQIVPAGRSSALVDVDKWFKERLMPNTVSISKKMYNKSLYRALRLLVFADIAKTDFGSSRQRDFGQMLTDSTRGFLGELAVKKFLKDRFNLEVKLEEKEVGEVEQFLPTDISYIKDGASWRKPKLNFSIKTSKLGSMWLDIPGSQLSHSDVFCFIKIGLTVDHFIIFMKETGIITRLVEVAQQVGEVEEEEADKELQSLLSSIPGMTPLPTYVAGFVKKEDFETGSLKVEEKRVKKIVVGGCGFYSGEEADIIEGLGDISGGRYLASIGDLRWDQSSWDFIIKSI